MHARRGGGKVLMATSPWADCIMHSTLVSNTALNLVQAVHG